MKHWSGAFQTLILPLPPLADLQYTCCNLVVRRQGLNKFGVPSYPNFDHKLVTAQGVGVLGVTMFF